MSRILRHVKISSLKSCFFVLVLFGGIAATSLADSEVAGVSSDRRTERLIAAAHSLQAREDYAAYCAGCHGDQGEGAGGIVDFGAPSAAATLNRQQMIEAVSHAHNERAAAAWLGALNAKQTEGVVDFIREAFMAPPIIEDTNRGKTIYAKTCSVCHGERGDGASWARHSLFPPPIDFTSSEAQAMSRLEMINAAYYGLEGTAMMPFSSQFSRDEIAAVVDYVRTNFTGLDDNGHVGDAHAGQTKIVNATGAVAGADTAGIVDMAAPFENALVGDYVRGRTLYLSNCAECHGAAGDGNGRRAYFIQPRPMNFTSDHARHELNRPHLFAAIAGGVVGREMPAWSKVLNEQQIADIAEYALAAFIQPELGAASETGSSGPQWAPEDPGAAKKN
ncbi:MAG: c-type cytochrome [Hyphomicrobiaceae bacterium]